MSWQKIAGLGIFLLNVIIFSIFLFTHKYPPFLVFLNVTSVVAVWIWLLNPKKLPSFFKEKKADFYIAIILFVLSLTVLIYKIDTVRPGIYGDEIAAVSHGMDLLKIGEMSPFIASHANPLLHGYLAAWSVGLFGHNLFAVRLPSVVAGGFSAIALYILLRLFFKKRIALVTSLIFVFSYQSFVIFRQSYETGGSVLFQIVALIFLYLLFKKKDLRSLIGFGLAIGASFHFYVSIRLVSFSMIIFSLLAFRKFPMKKMLRYFTVLLISIFVSATALSSYTATHWNDFWQRSAEISVFGRHLPAKDVAGEISGSVVNDMGLFIFSGDPNPRYNPSGLPLYDPISSILIVSGFALLFFKQRKLFFIFLFLSLPVIANEIFAIEVFPEAHYYGTGHPNSLRISGFIPLFYLLMGFAFVNLESLLQKISRQFANIALIFVCVFAAILNFYIYFGQESINPAFFIYNYRYGNAYTLDVYDYLNKKDITEAYATNVFDNSLSNFFLDKPAILKLMDGKNVQQAFDLLTASKVVIVSMFDDKDFINKLMQKVQNQSVPYIRLNTPFGPYGAVIFNSN